MGVAQLHSIYGVQFYVDSQGGAAVVGSALSQSLSLNSETSNETRSGTVYSSYQAITAQKPAASLETNDIKGILDILGVSGLKIASATNPGVTLYGYAHSKGSSRTTGTTHDSYTIGDGIAIPKQLTVEHGGDARLTYDLFTTYDGSNDPIVIASGVSVPAVTDPSRWTLGPVSIGGNTYTQKMSLTIDFGIRVEANSSDGEVWPTFASIEEVLPTITMQGNNIDWFGSSFTPIGGDTGTHANTSFYLRKRTQGTASFVADGTAEHIKFTADGMSHITQPPSGSGSGKLETALEMLCRFDGTNAPITVDTASAIT